MKNLARFLFIACLGVLSFTGCKDPFSDDTLCTIKRYCDLLIPYVVQYTDGFGNNIAENNQYFQNERTSEDWKLGALPVQSIQQGDWLKVGVWVFNKFTTDLCTEGSDAPNTKSAPRLRYTSPTGQQSTIDLQPANTDGMAFGDYRSAISRFQVNQPGYYWIDFDANHDRTADEYSFGNNLFNSDSDDFVDGPGIINGHLDDRSSIRQGFGFYVAPNPNFIPATQAPVTQEALNSRSEETLPAPMQRMLDQHITLHPVAR